LDKPSWKKLLPQVNPEEDCVPAPIEEEEEKNEAQWRAVGAARGAAGAWPWSARPRISGRPILIAIEKIALAFESLINRLVGSERLNPFYHTDTISVFLLIVVAVTGVYLTLFYVAPGLGTRYAYGAVLAIDEHWLWLGRIMRGAHRYASGAAVITVLLHALRTLFQDRFRGARWLAWFTGMLLLAAMWFEGLTGYWLVWDERAQLILDTVIRAINVFPSVGVPFTLNFLSPETADQSWIFFLLLLFVHIALFTVIGLFFWFHILRLSRAKFLPSRYYMIALGILMAAAALLWPATNTFEASFSRLPGQLTFDPFFLFYLPATLRVNPAYFWAGAIVIFVLVTAVPWLFKGKVPGQVIIDKDLCTGCTKCAEDCPYNAIVMVPRHDGKPHKLIALENPNLCVSCGVCIGSCDGLAVSLGDLPATDLYRSMLQRVRAANTAAGGGVSVVLTCERHAAHGAHQYAREGMSLPTTKTEVITIPCVGALQPNIVGQLLDAGAAEVKVVGCPAVDCTQREGNLWIAARLDRTRAPRLKRDYIGAPIHTYLLPPNEFARALESPLASEPGATKLPVLKPLHFLRGSLLLAVCLALQVALTDMPYQPYAADESLLQIGMRNSSELRENFEQLTGPELAQLSHDEQVEYLNAQQAEGRYPTRLRLEIDGQVILAEAYSAAGLRNEGASFAFGKFYLRPGEHAVMLSMDDAGGELTTVIEQTITFGPGEIHTLLFDPQQDTFVVK
jgi:ferredoxin